MRCRRRRTGGRGQEEIEKNAAPQAPCKIKGRGTRSCWRCTFPITFTISSVMSLLLDWFGLLVWFELSSQTLPSCRPA
eukprot:gene1537-biopygen19836